MHPNSMKVLHRFISTKENKLMFVVTWGSELTFSWHSTTLCVQVLEKENGDWELYIVAMLGAIELNWHQSCFILMISTVKSLKQGAAETLSVDFIK